MNRASVLTAFAGVALLASIAGAGTWDVGNTAQPGQWTIYNRTGNGAGLGLPVAAGDVNHDGRDDVIISPMNAASGPSRERNQAGEVAIVLSAGTIAGVRDLAQVDPAALPGDVALVFGADPIDLLGTHVEAADLDGDTYADVIIGAQLADGPQEARPQGGEAVIVWGGPDLGGKAIDVALLPRPDITVIYGANAGDRLGVWVSAGDFDGDGTADALLGADQVASVDGLRTHAGATYVVYGASDLRSHATIDLREPAVAVTLIHGIDTEDHSGSTVRGADLNGDGAAEILIGAGLNRLSSALDGDGEFNGHHFAGGDGPQGDRPEAGEAYVVYGEHGVRPTAIDLSSPPSSTVIVYGADAGDAYGEELAAGDFDGDGIVDFVVAALTADGPDNLRDGAGEAALIRGGPSLPGSVIDLAAPPSNVTIFSGAAPSEIGADTALLVDLDDDTRDDLLLGRPLADPNGRENAGIATVLFGSPAPLPPLIDLAADDGLERVDILGGSPGDILAYSGVSGDFDGNGVQDVLLNGMGADGFDDLLEGAGEVYVLAGPALAEARLTPADTPTATATPSATATGTPTATETATNTAIPTPTATAPATATQVHTSTEVPPPSPTATTTSLPTTTATSPPAGSSGCGVTSQGSGSWLFLLVPAILLLACGQRREARTL